MEPLEYTLHDATDVVPTDAIRHDLRTRGVAVVRLYSEADAAFLEEGMDELAMDLCGDGGSACGGLGMGGITKPYGAACHPAAARARLDPCARRVHSAIYGVDDVICGWDAVAILGTDAVRPRPPRTIPEDPEKAYHALTGGRLKPHVDIGLGTLGTRLESEMARVHPDFAACVQSQLVCRSVPRGGATLVVAPGEYYDAPTDPTLFDTSRGRDFCVATRAGYAHFAGRWRAVEAPRGCLILWLSHTPHGNKLADVGVDPRRRVVYIAWQARALVPEGERETLKRKKMEAVYSGGSTDHWATHVPAIHRGSHYSNGKKRTKVLYSADSPPVYDAELAQRIEDAF